MGPSLLPSWRPQTGGHTRWADRRPARLGGTRAAVLRRWRTVAGFTALVGVIGLGLAWLRPPVYQTSTTLLVAESSEATVPLYWAYWAERLGEHRARTDSHLLVARPILDQVIARLHLPTTADHLSQAVEVQLAPETRLIRLTVWDADPQRAADIANLIPQVFLELDLAQQSAHRADLERSLLQQAAEVRTRVREAEARMAAIGGSQEPLAQAEPRSLQNTLAADRRMLGYLSRRLADVYLEAAQSSNGLAVVEPAPVPRRPIHPGLLATAGVSAAVGFLVALGLAAVMERLDDRLKSPAQAEAALDLPVLGALPWSPAEAASPGPIAIGAPHSASAEAYRMIRTGLQFAAPARPLRRVLITSPDPRVGKSTVAANLAAVLAQAGRSVILLDADLRQPSLHTKLGLANGRGLSDLLPSAPLDLDDVLTPTAQPRLRFLRAGTPPPNPVELLGSRTMAELLDELGRQAETVIVDTCLVMVAADPLVLARHADAVILVLATDVTPLPAAREAIAALRRVGASLAGAVVTRAHHDSWPGPRRTP